jgi:hypothetical protein
MQKQMDMVAEAHEAHEERCRARHAAQIAQVDKAETACWRVNSGFPLKIISSLTLA